MILGALLLCMLALTFAALRLSVIAERRDRKRQVSPFDPYGLTTNWGEAERRTYRAVQRAKQRRQRYGRAA